MFALSYVSLVTSFYSGGDFISYQSSYTALRGTSLFSGYLIYNNTLGASEVVHFLISYIFSNLGVPYFLFKACLSGMLFMIIYSSLTRNGLHAAIALTFCIGNFYVLALYTELERLSLAFLFFSIFLSAWRNSRKSFSIIFLIMSLLTHLQMGIIILALLSSQIIYFAISSAPKKVSRNIFIFSLWICCVIAIASTTTSFLQDLVIIIREKLYFYKNSGSAYSLIQGCIALTFAMLFSKRRIHDFAFFMIIFIFIFFLGGERLNIVLVLATFWIAVQNNRWRNIPFHVFNTFFLGKGLLFLLTLLQTGRGYA
jgi:hypothetical protein